GRATLSAALEYPQSSAWVKRSLINLDLSAIPAGAQIKEAAVNLYSPTPAAATSGVELRQLTSAWDPNTVTWGCASREGATCQHWATAGGDFSSAGSEILVADRGSQAGWWNFTKGLAPVFQGWVEGKPRAGLILKLKEESSTGKLKRLVTWDSSQAS